MSKLGHTPETIAAQREVINAARRVVACADAVGFDPCSDEMDAAYRGIRRALDNHARVWRRVAAEMMEREP